MVIIFIYSYLLYNREVSYKMNQLEIDIAEWVIDNKETLKLDCYPKSKSIIEMGLVSECILFNLQRSICDHFHLNGEELLTIVSSVWVVKILGKDFLKK